MRPEEGVAREGAVVWSAPVFNRTGWAEEARNAILALDHAGVRVHANPIVDVPWQTRLPAGLDGHLEQLVVRERPRGHVVHVMHYSPRGYLRHHDADRHVGRPMWEFETPPQTWVAGCNLMDEVWVPSDFNVEGFVRAGVAREKLHKVPEALQTELYDPAVPPLELPGANGFVFLSVFGWVERKGWDVLVRAYLEEFRADEGVTLVLKLSPYFGKRVPEMVARLDTFVRTALGRDPARSAPIVVLDLDPGAHGMPRLYRAADAFVLPTRGEGWGRPYMEAMAMGLPTIGTRWSGNLEFMTEENAYLIDCTLTDVSEAGCEELPFLRGHRWAEPSVEHLRALMRRVFTRREEAAVKGERARADMLARCSWGRLAEVLLARLEALGLPRRPHAPATPRPADIGDGATTAPARARILLVSQLPDETCLWNVPANEVRAWAYVLGGGTRSFHRVLAAPDELAAYDIVIVELMVNAYSVVSFIKQHAPRVTVIGLVEGGVEALAAHEPRDQLAFVECVRQLDLLGVLVESAVPYYRLLVQDERRVQWLGIPYPKAYTDALPKPPRAAKAPIIEIAGNLGYGRNALAAMLCVRRLRRTRPTVRGRLYVPRPAQMDAGQQIDPTIEYRLERDWSGYYRHHLDAYAMLCLDPRRSWGRPVLDCASAMIPYVGSYTSHCGAAVGVLTCDPYDVETAHAHLCRLLADPVLYEEVVRTQYARLAMFDEERSRQRFWHALAAGADHGGVPRAS